VEERRGRDGGGEEGEGVDAGHKRRRGGWRQGMRGDEERNRESGKMEVGERKWGRDGDG